MEHQQYLGTLVRLGFWICRCSYIPVVGGGRVS